MSGPGILIRQLNLIYFQEHVHVEHVVDISAVRLISIFSSGYSAFSATIQSAQYVSIQRDGKPLGAFKTAVKETIFTLQ